jgi:hypothetical protein
VPGVSSLSAGTLVNVHSMLDGVSVHQRPRSPRIDQYRVFLLGLLCGNARLRETNPAWLKNKLLIIILTLYYAIMLAPIHYAFSFW